MHIWFQTWKLSENLNTKRNPFPSLFTSIKDLVHVKLFYHGLGKTAFHCLFLLLSGRFRGGGALGTRSPMDQNFFNFIGFSKNIIIILGRRAPPRDWRPLLGEVLDPPCFYSYFQPLWRTCSILIWEVLRSTHFHTKHRRIVINNCRQIGIFPFNDTS